jgi:hypothetical protein
MKQQQMLAEQADCFSMRMHLYATTHSCCNAQLLKAASVTAAYADIHNTHNTAACCVTRCHRRIK